MLGSVHLLDVIDRRSEIVGTVGKGAVWPILHTEAPATKGNQYGRYSSHLGTSVVDPELFISDPDTTSSNFSSTKMAWNLMSTHWFLVNFIERTKKFTGRLLIYLL